MVCFVGFFVCLFIFNKDLVLCHGWKPSWLQGIFLQFLNQAKSIPVGKQTQPCLLVVVLHVNTLFSGMSVECLQFLYLQKLNSLLLLRSCSLMLLPHSLIWQKKEIHCTQGPTTCMLCIQLEHPNNSVLTEANLDVAFLCTSFPLQVAGLEQVECFGVDDNLPTSYLLLYSFTKLPGDLIIQFHQSLEILCHMNVFLKCDKEQCWDRTTANCGQ